MISTILSLTTYGAGILVGLLSGGPALLLLCIALFLYVMTRNYRRLRTETLQPNWRDGERPLDQARVDWTLLRTETALSTERVVQLRLNWFLSKRKLKVVELEDVHSIVWRRYTNWFLLALGLYFAGSWNPLALLLILFGLQGKVYSVRFATPFAQMPFTRIVVTTFWRPQLQELRRFYTNAFMAWSRVHAGRARAGDTAAVPTAQVAISASGDVEKDFAWGRSLLCYVGVFMVLATLQRAIEPHISYDDYLFAVLYLALPVAVAHRSPRDAVWVGLLGFVGLLTMKFPGGGLLAVLTNDGRLPAFGQYAVVLLGIEIIIGVAALLAHRVHQWLGFMALGLWLGVIRTLGPNLAQDFGLYTLILLAMGAALVLVPVDRAAAARLNRA